MSDASLVGGWSSYGPLTGKEEKVFEEAMRGFLGVNYKPEEVSSQVVNGMNYRYICLAQPLDMPIQFKAIVEIHAPREGKPFIMSIHRI